MGPLRIVRLTAENVKRLKVVDITPEGSTVLISGRNGQGKTSVLDSIWYALGGKDVLREAPEPIRAGQAGAQVRVDLGDIVVTRRWTAKGTYLKVENADGASYGSPQALLDSLVGRLSFDPLAFARAKAADQLDMLRQATGLDLTGHDEERKALYDQRTEVNRDAKRLGGLLASLPVPSGEQLPTEEIQARDVATALAQARTIAKANEAERSALVRLESEAQETRRAVREAEERLAHLREEAAKAEARFTQHRTRVAELETPDVEGLEAQLADLEHLNFKIRQANAYDQAKASLEEAKRQADSLTHAIEQADETRRALIAGASLPVEGLTWDDSGVLYQGHPFSQASAAEQLRVSLAVAMALNPKLRVLRITDGSLLDPESLMLIEELVDAQGFQIWIEVVDTSGKVGVYIEDGEIVRPVQAELDLGQAPPAIPKKRRGEVQASK